MTIKPDGIKNIKVYFGDQEIIGLDDSTEFFTPNNANEWKNNFISNLVPDMSASVSLTIDKKNMRKLCRWIFKMRVQEFFKRILNEIKA